MLLDFWTFCCINCLHVLDELRPLEEKYPDVLVIVGVHSPKFVHEADPDALAAAVERYEVHHPVLDDPELTTWRPYAVRAWPTLVVVDPEGYVVAQLAGEGHAHALDALVAELVAEHEAKGTLHRGDGPYVAPPPPATDAAVPGQGRPRCPAAPCWSPTAGHHSLVELAADGETVVRRIGSGERGLVDGDADQARFSEPQGLCLLPPDVAEQVGYDVVVADTVNHALRGVRLDDRRRHHRRRHRRAVDAGRPAAGPRPRTPLSSPWDVAWSRTAGSSSRWPASTSCGFDPVTGGDRRARRHDERGAARRPAAEAWFAQTVRARRPTATGCGWPTPRRRRCARSRTVSVTHRRRHRAVRLRPPRRAAEEALLQHPLGVTVAARRLGRGERHLQRRGAPLRPGDRRGHHARHRAGRAERRRVVDGDACWSSSRPRTG